MNLEDDYIRSVVIIGIPYPNFTLPKEHHLSLYRDRKSGRYAGKEARAARSMVN